MANRIGLEAVIDVTQFNQGLRLYIKGMLDMTSATQRASSQINSLGTAASAGLGAALGTTAVNAVQSFIGVLGNLGQALIENASFFEGLTLSLNFFAARALQEETDMPLNQALRETQETAQGLMLWVERLAVLSPFNAEQVGNAFRTAQAYGLSLAAAQKLVPLMIDFAAINRLSPELLQRIALALAQVESRGKLASQEMNQLANAGFPMRNLLAKAMGVTRGELEKMLEDGLVPASTAIGVIMKELQNFEGAAERVARGSMQGIISSLQDLVQISSRDIFGPMFKAFFPLLNQLIDIGNSTSFKAGVKVIGQDLGENLAIKIRLATSQVIILAQAFNNLPPSVIQSIAIFIGFGLVLTGFMAIVALLAAAIFILINPFTVVITVISAFVAAYSTNFKGLRVVTDTVVSAIGTAFTSIGRVISSVMTGVLTVLNVSTRAIGELSGTVIEYGAAVVDAFVAGIMGAMGLLSNAMQFIGTVLSFWLAPGSPPRVAPDLDTWGTGAANVWLKGWLGADFNMLSSIADDIGSVLGALVSAGKLDELSAPRIIQALRRELAGAIGEFRQFGKISEETLNRVAQSAGPAANQVKELLKGYVVLAVETDAVRAAQEKLNEITERYDAILTPLRQKLSDISELREKADEQKEILSLQRLIANSGVGKARKDAAQFRIQEIMLQRQVRGIEGKQNKEETAAELEQKAAEKRKTNAEEQLERTKALIEIQNEQLNLYGQELQILEKIRKEQERLAREARQKMLDQLKKQLEIAQLLQAELKDAIAIFKAQYTLADGTATAAEKAAAALELQAVAGRRIVRDFEAMELGIDPAEIQRIRDTLITLKDIGIKGSDSPFDGMSEDIFGVAEDTDKLVKEMNAAMQDIRGMFKQTREEIDLFLTGINDMLPPFLKFRKATVAADKSGSDHLRTLQAESEEFNKWPPLLQTLSTAFSGIAAGLITSRVLTMLPKLLLGLTGPVGIITAVVATFASAWAGNWFGIREVMASAILYIQDQLDLFFASEGWVQFALDVDNAINTVLDAIAKLGSVLHNTFRLVIEPLVRNGISFETVLASLEILRSRFIALWLLIKTDLSQSAQDTAKNLGTNIRGFIEAYWNPFLAILILSSRSIVKGFAAIFVELGKQFSFLPRLASFTLRAVLTLIGQAILKIMPLIGKALSPVNALILKMLGGLGNLLAAVIVAPFKLIGKAIDLNAVLSPIITGFEKIFRSKFAKIVPKLWLGLVEGLVNVGAGLGRVLPNTISLAFSGVGAAIKAQFAVFKFLDKMTFFGFETFVRASNALQKLLPILGVGVKLFGDAAWFAIVRFADAMVWLQTFDVEPVYAFFRRIKPTATATMPILAELFDGIGWAIRRLTPLFVEIGTVMRTHFFDIFNNSKGFAVSLIENVGKITSVLGKGFVSVFQNFKGVGTILGDVFKGLGASLRNVATLGSIKVLKFLQGLSRGILTFAGKGQAKLGQALAGIFQGAFKGITGSIAGAPKFIGEFFKNIGKAAAGKAIKGPVVLGEFFKTLAGFNPRNIIKTIGGLFGSIKKISGAFGGLLNPINLIIAALDFFGFAFTHNIAGVKNRAVGFVNFLRRKWADLISGKLWQDIQIGFANAFKVISDIWTEFQTNGINSPKLRTMLLAIGVGFVAWAQETGGKIWSAITEFWLPIFGNWIRISIENLGTTIGQIAIFLRDWIVIIGGFLAAEIGKAWTFFWTWWSDQGGAEKTGAWLQGIIDIVWGWIKTSAEFIKTNFIDNWLPAFIDWIKKGGLTNMVNNLTEWLGGVLDWILKIGLPWLVNTLLSWATALIEWIGPALGKAIIMLATFVGGLVKWIIGTGIPLLVTGVVGLIGAIIGWIAGTGEDTAEKKAPTELQKFLTALLNFITTDIWPALVTAGTILAQSIWDGFVELWGKIMTTEPIIEFEKFLTAIQNQVLNFRQAGVSIGQAIWNGIKSAFIFSGGDPATMLFNQALLALILSGQKQIEGHSPSKLAKRLVGDSIAEGVMEGVTEFDDISLFKAKMRHLVMGVSRTISKEAASSLFGGSMSSPFSSRPGTFLPSSVTNVSRNNTFALSVNSDRSSQGVISDFSIMQTMAGY